MKKRMALLIIGLIFSCVESPNSPEGVLATFVNKRFDGASIDEVKEFVTDDYLGSVVKEVEGTKYETLKNLKKKKFKIISKRCDAEDCKVTYFISYVTVDGKSNEFETETKKIASVKKIDDSWLIDKIDHIKTYHDMVKNLDIHEGGANNEEE